MAKKGCIAANSIPTTWNGIEYPSMTHAARALGITKEAMRHRVNNGYKSDNDLRKYPETKDNPLSLDDIITIVRYLKNPNTTMSMRDIAKLYGVSVNRIKALL